MAARFPATAQAISTARCAVAAVGCLVALVASAADGGGAAASQPGGRADETVVLDLKLGDLRRYMDPALLDTPPDDFLEEIIVRGRKPEPLPEHRSLPRELGAIIYAFRNPLQAWRIVLPDPHQPPVPLRTIDDPKEAPGAFRGKILEPGAIYD